MSLANRITDANQLQEFSISTRQSLNNKPPRTSSPEPTPQKEPVDLILLQPLANRDMFNKCRDRPCDRFWGTEEDLNIQPLGKAWRQALMRIPPIPRLVFDVALPSLGESEKWKRVRKLFWDRADTCAGQEGFAVCVRDVTTLVITIATEMRMRAGGDVSCEVRYDETDEGLLTAMKVLERQLLAISMADTTSVEEKGDMD
ncbi:hypothetical protein PHISCL_06981 [Aspergillus sclerotialis]|uniref:Uncharacterized protein n=1 Tax=Aspergillus sclerotialis TaxID=2070753 RepID=A0A3A2ZC21_9EURO|nr:hypothetical protein PHISCL_06981 [Aspergillus sclerotialis]